MAERRRIGVPAWRFYALLLLLLAAVVLLLWRVLSLQVLDSEYGRSFLKGQGDARTLHTVTVPGTRGMILDRNGEALAVSTPVASLWMHPGQLSAAPERWAELARALKLPLANLEARVKRARGREFFWLRRHLSPAEAEAVLALEVPGIYMNREYRRFYPAGEVAAHLVGFTDIDGRGQEGLELAYQDWLAGSDGSKRVLRNLRGQIVRDVDSGRPAEDGEDLVLSIDLRLQYLAYRELLGALERTGARAGSVVVLDAGSGEVLAMVNQPSFNPNDRSQLRPGAVRNRALTDLFEPGSTVKPLTIVAALESGRFQADTPVDTNPGWLRVGRKTLLDPKNYGVLDVAGVLKKSSQVGTSKIALALDEEAVREVFGRFGLGRSTGSGFPGEANGVLPAHRRWRPIERANFAFGYGLSVTSLQLARAYAVIAAGGSARPVSLLRRDRAESAESVIESPIAEQLTQMLESVTGEGGTGGRARIPAYRVAGKTGTVHKVGEHGYADNRYLALFAGFAPASNPRIVTVVTIDEPGDEHYYGGEVAAPVFSTVTEGALRLLNVAPDGRLLSKQKNKIAGAAG